MSDDGLSGWHVLAFALGALAAAATLLMLKRRCWITAKDGAKVAVTDGAPVGCTKNVWTDSSKDLDVEQGVRTPCPKALDLVAASHVRETLRQLLESELMGCSDDPLKADSLDRLTDKVLARVSGCGRLAVLTPSPAVKACGIGNLRAAAVAAEAGSAVGMSGTDTRTPDSSDRSGSSTKSLAEELPLAPEGRPRPPAPPSTPAPVMPHLPRPLAVGVANGRSEVEEDDDDSQGAQEHDEDDDELEALVFGPTDRQLNLVEPPERCFTTLDHVVASQNTLSTVQKVLQKRDTQTTELHKQLREARQELWIQTAEARSAKARFHELLSDPSKAPAAQAEALARLKTEVSDLSSRLTDAREQAKQWQTIARRQRAFFLQSENMGQESLIALRRHPCGEVFLVPPPVTAPFVEEDEVVGESPGWNVGRSHCNPYEVDSWPFEPNVLAARSSREPSLPQCTEGPEQCEDLCEEDDDDGCLDELLPLPDARRCPPQQRPQCTGWSDDEDEEDDEHDHPSDDDELSPVSYSELDRAAGCSRGGDAEEL